jgi:hypothetical protein
MISPLTDIGRAYTYFRLDSKGYACSLRGEKHVGEIVRVRGGFCV